MSILAFLSFLSYFLSYSPTGVLHSFEFNLKSDCKRSTDAVHVDQPIKHRAGWAGFKGIPRGQSENTSSTDVQQYVNRGYAGEWGLVQFSHVQLFATPWIAACQASLSITNSRSSSKLMYIELVMPSSHLILCCPLLLLPPVPPSIRVFSNESTLRMRWPKYWSFSFSISPSKEHPGGFIFLSVSSNFLTMNISDIWVLKVVRVCVWK